MAPVGSGPSLFSAVAPYLAMSILYKRSNRLWRFLIRFRLVHKVWSPLVHWTLLRHPAFRKRLARETGGEGDPSRSRGRTGYAFSAGV